MNDPATIAIFVVPALGVIAALVLFVGTSITDRRALRRADEVERQAARG